MKKATYLIIFVVLVLKTFADEGMWLPMFLNDRIYEEMKKKGLKLSKEDIYSINNASLKDAVVLFGRGCTAEFISEQGLLLTNHHCGYGTIQSHSTLEHDYLTDGFWAKELKDELPNPGLTVSLLVNVIDVTNEVLANTNNKMTELERKKIIETNIAKISTKYSENKKYKVEIKPFFYGNQYVAMIYQVFKDVRLVGAPPSSIGKFGGDTDNWMWPRHTGDFSLFRVYANKNNEPAEYSPDNVPYKPKKHFKINISGIKEGDFTMVLGFPGTTQEYIPSYAVDNIRNVENPISINLRDIRLNVIKQAMDTSRLIRIQYANKQAAIANAWKKWIGENTGIDRLKTIQHKLTFEKDFDNWANIDFERSIEYGNILNDYKKFYTQLKPYSKIETYYFEGILSIEIINFSKNITPVLEAKNEEDFKKALNNLINSAQSFYKNYNLNIDKKIFSTLIDIFMNNVEYNYIPKTLVNLKKKYKNNWEGAANTLFKQSYICNLNKIKSLEKLPLKKVKKILSNDIFYKIYSETIELYKNNIYPITSKINTSIDSLNRKYIIAQMKFNEDKIFYPDANLTLRLSYGTVKSYSPADGIFYDWYTTLDGVIEKEDSTIYDYAVPAKLKELWKNKDYGRYGDNGIMKVCFIANNHTTGGNSGSPVLNANGELIGCNFDRTWESTMSDIHYDPDRCRNIILDIRYVLFIIDKFANAQRIIDELDIVS